MTWCISTKVSFVLVLTFLFGTNFYDFKIFRKLVIINVQMKPNSNMPRSIIKYKAYKICSKGYIDEESQLLIDVFTEHG